MQIDKLQHSSIQPWSAGKLFPFVIVQTDTHNKAGEFLYTRHRAINGPRGAKSPWFATYRTAAAWADACLAVTPSVPAAAGVVIGEDMESKYADAMVRDYPQLSREHVGLSPADAEWVRKATRAEVFERYPCPVYRNGRAVPA